MSTSSSRGVRLAGAAGTTLRVLLIAAPVLRVVLGLVLLGVGAWLWWPPAGLMLPGAVLVLDQLLPERAAAPQVGEEA